MITLSPFLFFLMVLVAVAVAIYAFAMGMLIQQKRNVNVESGPKQPKKADSETSDSSNCKIGKKFGYLRKLGNKKPIPQECLSCTLGIEECMKKK